MQYLFVPRMIAGITMLPLLVIIATCWPSSVAGWSRWCSSAPTPTPSTRCPTAYLTCTTSSAAWRRRRCSGCIFSLIACQKGYRASGGAEGVGRATTSAVVTANMTIVITDFFLTKVLF